MKVSQFNAPAVKCQGCAEAITTTLSGLGGIQSVSVDIPTKTVTVTHDEVIVTDLDIRAALKEAGFPAD